MFSCCYCRDFTCTTFIPAVQHCIEAHPNQHIQLVKTASNPTSLKSIQTTKTFTYVPSAFNGTITPVEENETLLLQENTCTSTAVTDQILSTPTKHEVHCKEDVDYPDMYSKTSKQFNCIQRAHQYSLENYPQFLFLLFVGGLQYPRISALAGAVYLAGRVAFATGYYTGDPAKRSRGRFGFAGMIILLGNTISFAAHQLKWVPCQRCC